MTKLYDSGTNWGQVSVDALRRHTMNSYQKELQDFRPYDEIQTYKPIGRGYYFIGTAGHGYLVVPKSDPYASVAKKICEYGYVGNLAYYLEEDCEYYQFMKELGLLDK